MALKNCKECGKEISTDASKCPSCGKPQTKSSTKAFLILVLLFIIMAVVVPLLKPSSSVSPQNTTPINEVNLNATDAQIYREFEVCMNRANKEKDDNKLEYQRLSGECILGLKKYGKKKAAKAFNLYFNI